MGVVILNGFLVDQVAELLLVFHQSGYVLHRQQSCLVGVFYLIQLELEVSNALVMLVVKSLLVVFVVH